MNGTLWVLLVATGMALMWAMRHTNVALLDAVLVRASAFSFAGAGVIGATGWMGTATAWTVATANNVGADLGAASVGSTAVWIVWAAISGMWVLTLLPERWFKKSIPDWLAFAGLLLPGLAASVPGGLGAMLRQVITACGGLLVTAVSNAVGIGG